VTGLTARIRPDGYFAGMPPLPDEQHRMPKPNDERIADDWESLALSRVAAHVEELPALPDEAEDFGWEAGVLEKLRKRLREIE
jgi:hypothetical protein